MAKKVYVSKDRKLSIVFLKLQPYSYVKNNLLFQISLPTYYLNFY